MSGGRDLHALMTMMQAQEKGEKDGWCTWGTFGRSHRDPCHPAPLPRVMAAVHEALEPAWSWAGEETGGDGCSVEPA
jgi:hypothetical protein